MWPFNTQPTTVNVTFTGNIYICVLPAQNPPPATDDLGDIKKDLETIMATVDEVLQGVTDENDTVTSIITLLGNISAQLAAAQTDPAKLQQVLDMINDQKSRMAAAVVANTSTAPGA